MGDWRVKYDGVCSRCGVALRAGELAVYDRPTRTIHCVTCPTSADREPEGIDAGVAGRSARHEHDRRAAKRETVVKERWGNRIGGVVLALTEEPQSTRAWAAGARGEEKLATALDGFSVLHDRRAPRTRGNIDHIVIAPAGVFVVDAKKYEGRIEIRNHGWF
ncbi:MAG TPA: nuclease-related domain-containing protein, partial [Thermoanaerobaculia bacterium]|nr:nuclease-related domain-containing protein [Thermoanaerobaculia bacterium]